jgi:two-component system, chemotaxis family, chemotaxis protein CheY
MSRPILVADFDLTRRLIVTRTLRGAGYDVVEAGDVATAETLLDERSFAIAFVAARLAGGDAFDVCRRWTQRGVRVVLVASDARAEAAHERARQAGAVGVMATIGDRDAVVETVRRILGDGHVARA